MFGVVGPTKEEVGAVADGVVEAQDLAFLIEVIRVLEEGTHRLRNVRSGNCSSIVGALEHPQEAGGVSSPLAAGNDIAGVGSSADDATAGFTDY